MSGMPKIIKTLTGVGTAIGVVVIIVGNAIIATSRGGSPVGLALRSLGLLLALIALGTFLCVSAGTRVHRDFMRRKQPAMETMNDGIRVTVCYSSRNGQIGYVWNVGDDSGWNGPFDSFDEAMDHAEVNVFGR